MKTTKAQRQAIAEDLSKRLLKAIGAWLKVHGYSQQHVNMIFSTCLTLSTAAFGHRLELVRQAKLRKLKKGTK